MTNPDRWPFCRAIFAQPREVTPRLVFADWLAEQGLKKAEQRQREIAKLLNTCVMFFKMPNPHQWELIVQTSKGLWKQLYVKKDGEALIGKLELPREVLDNWARDFVLQKANIARRPITPRLRNVVWIAEPILLNACEVAGIEVS